MWKTLVGKFQPLPSSSPTDGQHDLEYNWDERDTTGGTTVSDNGALQEERALLRATFFRCMEADNEEERARQFQVSLQLFVSIFGRQVSGQLISESLHDLKAFTTMAGAKLVQAIEPVREKDLLRRDASAAYMRVLRSPEICNALKAIEILAKAPDNLLTILALQGTHSQMLHAFLNLAEFPSASFDNPIPGSVASILIVTTLTSALKRLLWRKPILNMLIEQDEFIGLFNALVLSRTSRLGGDPAELYIWKARVMDVADYVVETTEVDIMPYLHSKDCAKLLSDALREYLVDGSIDSVHREEGILILRVIVKLIKKSSLLSNVLLDDFKANKIYETLAMLLVSPPFDEDMLTFKNTILSLVEELVFIDKEALPLPTEGTPYQHRDFNLPLVTPEHAGAVVRNMDAARVLVTALVYPDILTMTLLPPGDVAKGTPPNQFSVTVFATLLSIIRDHHMNYFLLEKLGVLSYVIERLDAYHEDLQLSIMELFSFVVKDLNYVPFRDLVVLSIHLHGKSSERTTKLVCNTLNNLLQEVPGFKDVLREVGIIDILCNILEDLSVVLKETFGDPNFNQRASIVDFGKAFVPGSDKPRRYGIGVIHQFEHIVGVLVELLRGNRENVSLFQKTLRGDMFSLLNYNETRDSVLRVIVAMVVESHRFFMEDQDLQSPGVRQSSISSSSSTRFTSAPFQLTQLCEILQSLNRYDFKMKTAILNALSEVFIECPDLKDAFREGGGYVSIVSLLIRLEDAYETIDRFDKINMPKRRQRRDPLTDERIPTKEDMMAMFTKVFSVLSESMRDRPGNSRYFEEHIGFSSLADALQLTGVFGPNGDAPHMFGVLFAFAVQDSSVEQIFTQAEEVEETPEMVARWLNSPRICIQHPHVVLGIWKLCMSLRGQDALAYCVLMSLFALSCANRRNQVLMGQTELLDELLRVLFELSQPQIELIEDSTESQQQQEEAREDEAKQMQKDIMSRLSKRLIEMGMSSFGFRYLMEKFSETKTLSFGETSGLLDMLLHGVTHSRWPSFVQFDGNNRLELRSLGNHQFPPTTGYTFLVWLCIESFDDAMPVQVLEISDEEQRCYLSVQIESDSHKLVVEVSHNHSVSFNFAFEVGRWYHLALVHAKPKLTIHGGSLSVYIDGILGDRVKCSYLSSPIGEVKAYLGRHQKPKLNGRKEGSTLSWNMGPAYLVSDALDVQIMDVLYNLSPRYHGNFQDSLGKFQTYETSTALNINLEAARRRASSSRSHDEQVALMNAIRGTIGNSIPEDKIIFAFSGSNLLDAADTRTVWTLAGQQQPHQSPFSDQFSRILFNSAIPRIHRGINPLSSIGVLVGSPLIAAPRGLDDSIWKVGGCVVALRIVESAKDTATLEKAVLLLDQLIRCSWRNSEDMERIFGYEILGYILKQKKPLFSLEMMNTLLSMVGMDLEYPDDSVITNSFAFRHLMLDMDIWRKTDIEIQLMHLEQFKIFLQHSNKSSLNVKRLSTMHVVKKMLAPLRTGNYPVVQLPHFVDAMKTVVFNHFSTETVRNIATFLVSTLKQTSGSTRTMSTSSSKRSDSKSEDSDDAGAFKKLDILMDIRGTALPPTMKHSVMGNAVMEMLEQILCDQGNIDYVHKFAATITNKWTLLFLDNPHNAYGAVLAMRILSRLLHTQGSTYTGKFRMSDGFLVLQTHIPQFWNVVPMIHVVLATLLGVDICQIPPQAPLDMATLNSLYKESGEANRVPCPEIMPTLMNMLKNGVAAAVTPSGGSRTSLNEVSGGGGDTGPSKVVETYQTLITFLTELQSSSRLFKDICTRTDFFDDIGSILFPFICRSSKAIPVETELDYRDSESAAPPSHTTNPFSKSSFDSGQAIDASTTTTSPVTATQSPRPSHSSVSSASQPTEAKASEEGDAATTTTESPGAVTSTKAASPGSNGGLNVPIADALQEGSFRRSASSASLARMREVDLKVVKEPVALSLLRLLVVMCADSVLDQATRPLQAIELMLQSCPPAYKDHQVYFQSFLLGHVIIGLEHRIEASPEVLSDIRVLGSLNQFCEIVVDLTCQGWFVGSYLIQFDLIASALELLTSSDTLVQQPTAVETVRAQLCSLLHRLVCFTLGQCQTGTEVHTSKLNILLEKCIYYQKVLLSACPGDVEFMKSLILHLFVYLSSETEAKTRATILTLLKLTFLMRPVEASHLLRVKPSNPTSHDSDDAGDEGYQALVEGNYTELMRWRTDHATELDPILNEFRKSWEALMSIEFRVGEDAQRQQFNRRTQKLKRLFRRQHLERNMMHQYRLKTLNWTRSIQEMEEVRYAKSLQDLDDHYRFVKNEWKNLVADVTRKGAIWENRTALLDTEAANNNGGSGGTQWRLDFTEARSRMRRKLRIDERKHHTDAVYAPKNSSSNSMEAKITSLSIPKTTSANTGSSPTDSPAPVIKTVASQLKEEDAASIASAGDAGSQISSSAGVSLEDALVSGSQAIEPEPLEDPSEQTREAKSPSEISSSQAEKETEEDPDYEPAFEEAANRKILRLLEAGDVVYEVFNMSRVTGLDAVEGLLLLCKNNMYLIDNYFQKLDGEVVDINEVPDSERDQYLQLLASNAPRSQPSTETVEDRHQCRRWRFEDIKEVHRRRYLLRNVALELFFVDGRNYLINLNLHQRDLVYNRLANRVGSLAANSLQMGDRSAMVEPNANNPAPSTLGSRLANIFAPSSLAEITAKWEKHEISNFQYLMHLNTMAGRTYNDLTQYPVFPWILADYTSEELDLQNPDTFRDLSRPMGAQTPDREKDFNDRYHTWDGGDERTPPFHYGTHYSSAMIVCSYLIRLEPFTEEYLKLQGGHFDHADRLFHSIGKSWTSASQNTMSDVRELIPEFFYLPEFLMNTNGFNFGTLQATGEQINHVALPPWAKGDPKIFIERHREALECDYVSTHLHEWIDLIFGYKQQGPEAVRAVNVFHHMSYEGSIDLDTIEDPIQKQATIGIIHNFGQTPRQLFKRPHTPRQPRSRDPLSANYYNMAEHAEYLTQSCAPMRDIGLPVGEILWQPQQERAYVAHSQRTFEPYAASKYVEWGFSDNSVRFFQTEPNKLLGIFENLHLEAITCVKWADDRTIVTTSKDTVVCVWRIVQGRSYELKLLKCLRGHRETVHTAAISVAYSVIVSGSEDKTCILWDLNRLEYVRELGKHEDGVRVVAINDNTGDIATCSGPVLRLWTINGDLILQKYTTQIGDPILDCIFYAGRTGEWVPKEVLFTSHRRGVIKVWEKAITEDRHRTGHGGSVSSTTRIGGMPTSSLLQVALDSSAGVKHSASMPHMLAVGAVEDGQRASEEGRLRTSTGTPPTSGTFARASMSSLELNATDAAASGSEAGREEDGSSTAARSRQHSQSAAKHHGSSAAKWTLKLRQAYTYEDRLRVDGGVVPNIVTLYISTARRTLYSGDSLGRVFSWVLPDGSGCHHWIQPGREASCVNCTTRFPLLERRFNCKTCGGVFCGTCTFVPVSGFAEKTARFCFRCASGKLKELMG
ncbi:hypothetical protein DFQ27_006020 [Actinomortierella ambigua]|uniref:Uncharacterized protein n=1 Tax=Actinomortierella ambigua TaxID=1343610 RepID=A0A9P6Q0L6_9FUNG|nr:hypothetical protein DFQ27_006020 [Actinomortierella ambigua]